MQSMETNARDTGVGAQRAGEALAAELDRAAGPGLRAGAPYAGIGSRRTPPWALAGMRHAAGILAAQGALLRSGGATGADTAFAEGCRAAGGRAEIMLPWNGYQGMRHSRQDRREAGEPAMPCPPPETWREAEAIAAGLHPAWHRCTQGVRKLHSRNVFIVLGADLAAPAAAVACWMDPARPGGTGMGVRIAEGRGIPVVNMHGMEPPR